MAQKGKRRGVSYYFRIEFNTLQGKITSGFCFLGTFAVILMSVASGILKPALEKSQYINQVLNSSQQQLLLLGAHSEKIVAHTENLILRGQGMSRDNWAASTALLQSPIDSLKTLSGQWQSKQALLSLKVAELKAESLLKKLKEVNQADSAQAQEALFVHELLPLQQALAEQLKTIAQIQAAEKKEAQAFIDYRSDNLIWILLGALLFSIITGGGIASYIVVRVIREIRMLKDRIFELGEGKLIPPIPNSRNELNSIIKAINTLTENLRNIQHFANEVGKGNFDTDVSVFGGENDLGESLAGMRDSLKSVALEEKHRNWVTSGLAQFSELLRNSSTDMDTYYRSIISELVRYLNVNQAAIYVLKQSEGEKEVLEMKASYAYGRLKYLSKVIEPGQGMAGQVFLEKEPVFLKNIPKNYTQISSGLGEATPGHLIVLPLKVNNAANGVLELASFQPLAPHEKEFLLKIAENISGAIQNVTNIHTTALLLQEAQNMAQAMQAQEEMLRQNSEELIATQEQLNRDLQETNQQLQLLEQTLNHSAVAQLLVSSDGHVQLANQQANALFNEQLTSKHISSLFNDPDFTTSWQSLRADSMKTCACRHPLKGELLFQLHSFAVEQQRYVNIQIIPQALVSLHNQPA